jgi:hypothetical protein
MFDIKDKSKQLEMSDVVRSYPSHPSKFIVVRMVIEVDTEIIKEVLTGENTGKPLTVGEMVKVMQREMEQIKETKYGNHTKLPDWFRAVDCAEIEENKEGK